MIGIYILLTSLFYLILLTIVYFSKKRILNTENKIFKFMLIANLIGILLDVASMIIIPMQKYDLLGLIVNKLFLVYLVTWITLFTFYTFFVSKYDEKFILKRINIFKYLYYISIAIVLVLPLEFVVSEKGVYSHGGGTMFIYMYSIVCIYLMIKMTISNYKKIGRKKYLPILSFLGIGGVVIVIQFLNPYLLLMTPVETFITFLMYFTIENPDLQIIEEYREIKEFSKKQNIDKVMFLHNTSQNLKQGLLNIERDVKYLRNELNDNNYLNCITDIDFHLKKMLNVLTRVYDPNLINKSEIKPYFANYESKTLDNIFKGYKSLFSEQITYSYKIDNNIPEYLYGDILSIKEILKEIITETINNIKTGYLDINVEVISKDNLCRLIIIIKDNGYGYSVKEIEDSLKDGAFKKYNDDLIKINGAFIINSEKNGLTEKIIVIDQMIYMDEEKKIDKLEHSSLKKKVMIVDNSGIDLEISKVLNKYNVDIKKVNYGVDCLTAIRNYEKYDLIIMNDEIEPLSGFETYKKLKENLTFKTPVVLLSKKKDFRIKEEYLKLGINDIISIPLNVEQLNEVVEKYL